jgi:glycosyltransferase involved in cell wall biosynthesis
MEKFDAVTLVTQEDIKACKRLSSVPSYHILTNGTDIHKYTMPIDNDNRKDILFTGRLDVEANRIMLYKICKDLMPAILQQVPDVQLHVAGAFPSADIERLLAKNENFHLHENVPDMVPYLQKARVYLHPHKGGSGIQNKLLEAMACGCPVVTSTTGNQGINAQDSFEAFVCESDNEFIRATVRLLKEDALMRKLSLNGRLLIKQTHSWETVHEQLKHVMARVFPQ